MTVRRTMGDEVADLVTEAAVREREACAVAAETRAARIEGAVSPNRLQPHTRLLPTEEELDRATFAARQLRILAEELRAGLHEIGEDTR